MIGRLFFFCFSRRVPLNSLPLSCFCWLLFEYAILFLINNNNNKSICFILQVAIPIVPTIRVLVTFTKFEELHPVEEFATPLSSPAHFQDAKSKESEGSSSWISWMRGSRGGQSSDSDSNRYKDEVDPFHIPSDYTWVDANEKKRRIKAKKAKNKKHKKQAAKGGNGGLQMSEDVEE